MIATVQIERFSLTSSRQFDEILAAIKAAVGHPDMVEFAKRTAAAPSFPEFESIVREGLATTGLMLFMELDHGAVIRKATGSDKPRMARLIMGNPLIMQKCVFVQHQKRLGVRQNLAVAVKGKPPFSRAAESATIRSIITASAAH
jgi:hypothetical protein